MKKFRILSILFPAMLISSLCFAQTGDIVREEGKCGATLDWVFDGYTLTIVNNSKELAISSIEDFNLAEAAPWIKKGLPIKKLRIGYGIRRIGSCAFAGCRTLLDVEFIGTDVREIGWGAFLNCDHLRNISLPNGLQKVETIAFANCRSLPAITIPDQCRIEDQAFLSCTGLTQINASLTSVIGHYAFAIEVKTKKGVRHALTDAEIKKLPPYINASNSHNYGIAPSAVAKFYGGKQVEIDYDETTSEVDKNIPETGHTLYGTYALILGNQNYRFAPDVPYAIHDARVFAQYCNKTLGIPSENIHICEDATKQMILEDEFDWLRSIGNPEQKKLIVYYAGHGVPDISDHNTAYLLPSDVRGTHPQRGISLNDFYASLGAMSFSQVNVFLDACFSGINRDAGSVNEGLRDVEIAAEEATISQGNLVVFSAAQGNETAQGYTEQGHGLFTYYLLKGIKDTSGMMSLGALADDIIKNVSKTAPQLGLRKNQTPTVSVSGPISEVWQYSCL